MRTFCVPMSWLLATGMWRVVPCGQGGWLLVMWAPSHSPYLALDQQQGVESWGSNTSLGFFTG